MAIVSQLCISVPYVLHGLCENYLTCDIAFNAVMPLSRASTRGRYSRIEGVTLGEDDEVLSRTTSFQEGEDDEDINTIVTPTAPAAIHTGPITRARSRQLTYQVLSFLGNDSNVHENMMLLKLDRFVLLTNEGPSLEKDEHWSKNKHGDDGMRKGNKNGVTSDDFRTLKPP